MKRTATLFAAMIVGSAGALGATDAAFEAEKKKALTNPYANDLGPDTLPEKVLAAYPPDLQKAYREILLIKCTRCHTAARPLNSQFYEVPGKGKEEKTANLEKLKASDPDMFSAPGVWQVETDIWQRYVKRMMAKPGCEINDAEGRSVYRFLVHDSHERKAGKNKAAWKTHREKLLADFKAKFPARHKELYEK